VNLRTCSYRTKLTWAAVGPWGAKLEAVAEALLVGSRHANRDDVQAEKYQLQPRVGGHTEILLLRPGDVISSSKATTSLTCVWQPASEVQVSSSAAEGVKEHPNGLDGVAETPEEEREEETEDEDIDDTLTAVKATQSKSQQPQATPQLSHQRSVIVQETPTTARVNGVTDYSNESGIEIDQPKLVEDAPVVEPTDPEPYSTARTGQSQNGTTPTIKGEEHQDGHLQVPDENFPELDDVSAEMTNDVTELPSKRRHPKVVVKSNKRPSPVVEEPGSGLQHVEPAAKRAKRAAPSDNDTQDSRLSHISVDTSPATATAKKGRKRKSAVQELEEVVETTPSRSQKGSQRSVSAPTAEPYLGDTPRVATSNSSITDKSQAVKFLKKLGGTLVESAKESFNVLCVRDGDLHKTSKVLQAIAAGTPIVTDKWLTDSAKASQFLSVDAYRPSAPRQEKEWKFKLDDVIGRPQTPFNGYTIHFTTSAHALYKPFTEIEQVCKAAGAQKVTTKKKVAKGDKVIVLAMEGEDKEAEKLMQDGVTCYYRHLLPMSIFRGTLDLDSDEFKIGVGADDQAESTKDTRTRRGRKA
jgi:hypothetical protein